MGELLKQLWPILLMWLVQALGLDIDLSSLFGG